MSYANYLKLNPVVHQSENAYGDLILRVPSLNLRIREYICARHIEYQCFVDGHWEYYRFQDPMEARAWLKSLLH